MNSWPWLSPLDDWWERVAHPRRAVRELLLTRLAHLRLSRPPDKRYLRPDAVARREVVELLAEAVRIRGVLDEEIAYLVAESRARRVSWQRIAEALQCRRQSAHARYGQLVDSAELTGQLDGQVAAALRHARQLLTRGGRFDYTETDQARRLVARTTRDGRLLPAEPVRRPPRPRHRGGPKVGA